MKKLLTAMLASLFLLAGCGGQAAPPGGEKAADAPQTQTNNIAAALTIKMLDVGQGDAILIKTAEQTVLIDTSDVDEREKLDRELKKADVTTIDKVILTHPHADHIGGIDFVLKNYDVKAVYDNDIMRDLPLYTGYLKELKKKNLPRQTLKDGDILDFGGGVRFCVISPSASDVAAWNEEFAAYLKNRKTDKNLQKPKHNFNLESIVGRLECGEFTMLFTGDAEKENEATLIGLHPDKLSAKVLKSPHHGSKTSSSPEFLDVVKPQAALISLGTGNDYGHPHAVTLKKYDSRGIKTYRTDLNGTITISVSEGGKNYSVGVEKEQS